MNFDKRSSPTRSGTTSCVFSMRVRFFAGLRGDLRFSESGAAVRLFADGTSGCGVAVSGPADREVNIRRALCSSADVLSFVGFFSLPSDRRASVPGADGASVARFFAGRPGTGARKSERCRCLFGAYRRYLLSKGAERQGRIQRRVVCKGLHARSRVVRAEGRVAAGRGSESCPVRRQDPAAGGKTGNLSRKIAERTGGARPGVYFERMLPFSMTMRPCLSR